MHPTPAHALTEDERRQIISVSNESRFADMPPARIVPMLADEGVYLASESSFSRVLRAQGQTQHRGRAKVPHAVRPPTTHIATAPAQVWCWDMTYLPTGVIGRWFYLYLILDLYSRKIVGWEVHENDHADHAAQLVRRTAIAEGIHALLDSKRPTAPPTLDQFPAAHSRTLPRAPITRGESMATDAKKLSYWQQQTLGKTPCDGSAYAFRNRRGNRIKLLVWDGSGVWLCQRRLHQGRFVWPGIDDPVMRLNDRDWQWLVTGVDWQRLSAAPPAHWRV